MNISKSFKLQGFGFGDLCATLYSLENVGRQNNIHFELQIDEAKWLEVFNQFNLDYLTIAKHATVDITQTILSTTSNMQCSRPISHRQGLYNKQHYITLLLEYLQCHYNYIKEKSSPLSTQANKFKQNIVYVQFDGRTAVRQNKDISVQKKINIVNQYASNWQCLGGLDSHDYGLGPVLTKDIKGIIHNLHSCKFFIGCDSGLSHLAGALGIPSKIFILAGCYHCVGEYYKSYNNCETFDLVTKIL